MANLWNVTTGSRLQTLIERSLVNILLPLSNNVAAEVVLISGSIPTGTRLEGKNIVGTVYEVAYDTTFNAVFRATTDDHFQDCTIEFVVTGPDSPNWITNTGLLAVGSNNSLFILDNEIIDYQLVAADTVAFVCGPPAMSDSMVNMLTTDCDLLAENVHTESWW